MSAHSIPHHPHRRSLSADPRQRLVLRVGVLLSRWRLDAELARGTAPSASPALALRAGQLSGRGSRLELARGLAGVIEMAQEQPRLSAAAPLRRAAVLRERIALEQLAARLRHPDPVAPRGIALTRRLLSDGTGPLYAGAGQGEIWEAAREALAHLEP